MELETNRAHLLLTTSRTKVTRHREACEGLTRVGVGYSPEKEEEEEIAGCCRLLHRPGQLGGDP